jgi:cytochrome c551/c552
MATLRAKARRIVVSAIVLLIALFIVAQLIPVDKTNPPVVDEPAWDAPRTRELAQAACFDCHSNETVWPWYSKIAPASWLLVRDVNEGRGELNFSEWSASEQESDELVEAIRSGEMPPWYYALMHPEARLSDVEKDELIAGLRATVGDARAGENREDSDD